LHSGVGQGLILVEEQDEHPGGSVAAVAREHMLAELAIGAPAPTPASFALQLPPPSHSLRYRRRANRWQLRISIYILDELVLCVLLVVYDDLVREGAPICPLVALTWWPLDI
jgi:hypothetical protein